WQGLALPSTSSPLTAGKDVDAGLRRHDEEERGDGSINMAVGISLPPERRPAVHETCGIVFRPLAERLAVLWCERARVLVEPGASKAPPIAPRAARLGSALFRL